MDDTTVFTSRALWTIALVVADSSVSDAEATATRTSARRQTPAQPPTTPFTYFVNRARRIATAGVIFATAVGSGSGANASHVTMLRSDLRGAENGGAGGSASTLTTSGAFGAST